MKHLLSIAMIVCISLQCTQRTTKSESKTSATPLPTFNILLPDSATRLNTARIKEGRPIVLVLFSPDCPYCQAEIGSILNSINQLTDVRFYLVTPYAFSDMRNFVKQYQLARYSNIIVGQDYANFYLPYSKTPMIPYTAVYDGSKRLKKAIVGASDVHTLQQIIEE